MFLRIFPMYWLALCTSLLVLPLLKDWRDAYNLGLQPILQNFILLGLNLWPNDTLYIGPAWTLILELQYYLVVALLMAIRPNIRLLLMVAIAAIGVYMLIHPTGLRAIDRSFLPWSVYFFAGMLLYMKAPKARFFSSRSRLDKELGELAYPLFILHSIVIQATAFDLGFWPLMLCNIFLSVAAACAAHVLRTPTVTKLRQRVACPVAVQCLFVILICPWATDPFAPAAHLKIQFRLPSAFESRVPLFSEASFTARFPIDKKLA